MTAYDRIPFLSKAEYHCVSGLHFVTNSPIIGYVGWFHLLAVMDDAAINADMQPGPSHPFFCIHTHVLDSWILRCLRVF